MTPDSLRSEKDKKLYKQIEAVFFERFMVSNDRLKLTIGKKEWMDKGLSEVYYDILIKDIEDVNKSLDSNTVNKQEILDTFFKIQTEYNEREKSKQ